MSTTRDPGFGFKYKRPVNRLINNDGTFNIVRQGGLRGVRDIYKYLTDLSWGRFILLALASYLVINAVFAILYLIVGVDQIEGLNTEFSDFWNAFFFSVQTLTSVGYGHLSPIGLGVNIIATFESFMGLVGIALMTGLLYGRFSKPSSKIVFSENIIITPHRGGRAVMFKMVNQRNTVLLNTTVKVIVILDKGIGDEEYNKEYHPVKLQIDSVNFFPLTWTVVHQIDEKSPFHELNFEEMKRRNAEAIILVEAFDETHSQMVIVKHSFGEDQWVENVKFKRNFRTNESGKIELYIDELSDFEEIK